MQKTSSLINAVYESICSCKFYKFHNPNSLILSTIWTSSYHPWRYVTSSLTNFRTTNKRIILLSPHPFRTKGISIWKIRKKGCSDAMRSICSSFCLFLFLFFSNNLLFLLLYRNHFEYPHLLHRIENFGNIIIIDLVL